MTTLSDVMKAVRDVVVMNERVTSLASRLERMDASLGEVRERVIRMEAFFEIVRPIITARALPGPRPD